MVRSAEGLKVKALEALWHFSFIDWGYVGLLACWQLYVFCVCSCAPSMCVYDRSLLCRCGIWHLSSVWTFPTMMLPICLWHIQPTLIVCSSVCFSFSFFFKMSSQFYVLFWSPFPVLFQYDIVICHKTYINLKSVFPITEKMGFNMLYILKYFYAFTLRTCCCWAFQWLAAARCCADQLPDVWLCVPESEWHGKWKVKDHVCMPECLFWMLIHPHLHVLIACRVRRLNDWLLARGDLKQNDGHSLDVCGCSTVWDMTWRRD